MTNRMRLLQHLPHKLRNDEGMTTPGMAIALLLTISLVLSTAQVYRIGSASAEVQDIADAAALAAQNEVAEFMIAARTCDALVLSMNLLGSALYGAGTVAACVPPAQSISISLLEMGKGVFSARDAFSQRATAGLNQLQRALPFLAAAKAATLASSQSGALGTSYMAIAVLVPTEGSEIPTPGNAESPCLEQKAEESHETLMDASSEAEKAAQNAYEAKLRAFNADCGAAPGFCLYERASRLAGLSDASNPKYESVDTWSFAVPLERAKSYYAERLRQEKAASSKLEDQINSALRSQFYQFALNELETAYVQESEDAFDASFPTLPANASEIRASELYKKNVFPCTQSEGVNTLHAWPGCPQAAGSSSYASLAQMEAEVWPICSTCQFNVSMMGNVAAATTSTATGFEHHLRLVSKACDDYKIARARLDPKKNEAKTLAEDLIGTIKRVMEGAKDCRINAEPPGSKGCVAFVIGSSSEALDQGLSSSFVQGNRTLGTRIAISAATLVEDPSGEGQSIITAILDSFDSKGSALGIVGLTLDAWSALLSSYASGQSAITNAIESLLGGIPLDSKSNLGSWAARKVKETFASIGLAPADLDALKPVLVNSGDVAKSDEGGFTTRLLSLKEVAFGLSGPSTDLFSSALSGIEGLLDQRLGALEKDFEIAQLDLGFAGTSIPFVIALPHAASDGIASLVENCLAKVRSAWAETVETEVWQ